MQTLTDEHPWTLPLLAQLSLACISLLLLPVAMAWVWIQFFAAYSGLTVLSLQQGMAVSGIAAVYGIDRLLDPDPRLQSLMQLGLRSVLLIWSLSAVLIAGLCFIAAAGAGWQIVLLCIALALANWFGKRLWLGKTLSVTAAWLCTCALLPFAALTQRSELIALYIIWSLLFALSCILCDIKDIDQDRLQHVASLPVLCGERSSLSVCRSIAAAGVLISAVFGWPVLMLMAGCLFVCASLPVLLRHPVYATMLVDGSLLLSGLVVFFV